MSTSPDVTTLNIQSGVRPRQGNPLRTAPNLLTLLRIFVTPLLVVEVLQRHFTFAFALFLIAAFTDALDGLTARWLSQRTRLGQYLDPAADKLLLSSLFLVFTWIGALDPSVAVIVFGRDLGMSLSALLAYTMVGVRDFRPTFLGKANSFCQVVAIGVILLSFIEPGAWVILARRVTLDASILLTVVSGFHYALVVSDRIGEAVDRSTRTPARSTPS